MIHPFNCEAQLRWGVIAILVTSLGACTPPPKSRPASPAQRTGIPGPTISHVNPMNQVPGPWFELSSTSKVGPTWDDGTFILLDGARALLRRDGSIEYEKRSTPEPLEDLFTVPTAKGPRLVGAGRRGIYRFDDPLGAGTLLAVGIPHIVATLPSAVVLRPWSLLGPDFFLDIETDTRLPVTFGNDSIRASAFSLPLLPSTKTVFETVDRGMTKLASIGVMRTDDAGKTWQYVGRDWPAQPNVANESLLLQWLRAAKQSPASLAVGPGFDLPDHQAFGLAREKLARIDTKNFTVLEILDYAAVKDAAPCPEADPGPGAWLGCDFKKEPEARQLGLLAMKNTRSPKTMVLTSPSGGAMLQLPCRPKKILLTNEVCVRTAKGQWETIKLPNTAAMMGPLADGRVAYLQNPEVSAEADSDCCQVSRVLERKPEEALRIVLRDPKGPEQILPPLDLPSSVDPHPLSGIEEAENGDLHFLVRADVLKADLMPLRDRTGDTYFITQPKNAPAVVELVPETKHASMHGRNLVAIGGKKIRTKTMGGAWTEVRAPESALSWVDAPGMTVHAREAGYSFGLAGHLGWANDELSMRPAFSEGLVVNESAIPVPAIPLHCSTTKDQGAIDKWGGIDDSALMASGLREFAPRTKLVKKTRDSWVLEVLDPWEEDADIHRIPITMRDVGESLDIDSVAASGARALAILSGGEDKWFMNTQQGSTPEIAPGPHRSILAASSVGNGSKIPSVLLVEQGPAFDRDILYVWFVGEAPRPMYEFARAEGTWLEVGEATPDGVPILLRKHEYIVWKLLPHLPASATPQRVDWTGFTKIDQAAQPSHLPTCTQPAPAGSVTFVLDDSLDAVIDGVNEEVPGLFVAGYKVRVTGSTACVSDILAPLVPSKVPKEAEGDPTKMPGLNFVRVHFMTGRAEGGAHKHGQTLRRLRCTR